jgi:hypothetical protein
LGFRVGDTLEELKKKASKISIFLKLDLSNLHATKTSAQKFLEYTSPFPYTA